MKSLRFFTAAIVLTLLASIGPMINTSSSEAGRSAARQEFPINPTTILYTRADGRLSVLIPHRFDVDTGEVIQGVVQTIRDQQSPPKVLTFSTSSIARLPLDWRERWHTIRDIADTDSFGAHLYVDPREIPAKDLSNELAEAYRRRDQIVARGF